MNINSQAVGLLKTWLDAVGIKHETVDGKLVVHKAQGGELVAGFTPKNVMSTDLDVCLGEFHRITDAAGHGKPMPVNRGKAAKKRVFDDSLLARWRHNEMRTVPNASSEELRMYEDVAKREARIFIGRNRRIAREMGYDVDVAANDALVWTNTFLGRYKLDNVEETRKLLTNYLRQRFGEMQKGLSRERKNVIPDMTYADYIDGFDSEDPDEEWKAKHDQLGTKSPTRRREKARNMLDELLSNMAHDRMVETLESMDRHPCDDVRKFSVKVLRNHRKECSICESGKSEVSE